jgi:carbon-monoxide dehydrogenase medium subunit/6-hydroxypseudooxynicotine dehydrogenase subunit alpha
MKPPPFAYAQATTIDEVLTLLDEAGEDAKIIAGGQSLMPLMAYRLARPSHLVDINHVSGHDYIRQAEGGLAIGALTRHATLEHAAELTGPWRALREAAGLIGHQPIRMRGTCGGSLAHADPSAELPVVATVLDARIGIRSLSGAREAAPADFFVGPFMTSLEPDEMIVEVRFPAPPAGLRSVFEEFSPRSGDFAVASACVALVLDAGGLATDVRIALGGVGPAPIRPREAEAALEGQLLTPRAIAAAAALCAAGCDPGEDQRTTVAYRRELVEVLTRRALGRLKEAS